MTDTERDLRTAMNNLLCMITLSGRMNQTVKELEALFATMSLTLERRKETALLRGSYLSYNEGEIGLTMHCLSFYARSCKL